MALNLVKLCVGCDSIGELEQWIAERAALARRTGRVYEQLHTTRMVPKRVGELDGGSLFWVIRGQVACRQRLVAVRPFTDGDGIGRCHLVLDQGVVPVEPRPSRPFQGWRYLAGADAPPDLAARGAGLEAMPEDMRRDLAALGLL
ncbi:DUF1489 family protein [Chelatococcus reniformis]|uniref:Lysophospholipase n=1 Tax=Chelatococcus reniformis TaxID=1494448 RepID=A0A916U2B4_9HYPH|nr:DUF1489 family protein [Chelatococcus reniformis]GGC57451.1 lysophospholipase [Chelatococcus reniformis]